MIKMNIEIEKTLHLIKRCVESNRPTESEEFFKNLQHYFEICDDAELDLALEQLFNDKHGTQLYLQISLPLKKIFKESNLILFALYRKLINEVGGKFKKFSKIVVTQLMNFITSTIVSAKEKELCVLVIDDLITNKLCECCYIAEIIEKLLGLFGNNAKNLPARFLQHTLELLGGMSKNYPGEFHVNAVYNFRDILFHTLEATLLDQKQLSFIIVSGVFQALDYYLYNFAPDLNQEPIICQKIYDRVKQISDPGEIRERQAFRKSLTLLTHHSNLIATQIYSDHLYWHNLLQKWMTWKYEDARVAICAMQSIHKEVANLITKNNSNDHDVEILKFYLHFFKRILVKPTAKSYEIRIAIRGIGVMAQPCQKLLPESYLDDLSTLVLQRIEYTDVMTENYNSSNRDMLEYLPDFIQALSQILGYVKNLSGLQIQSLQNVIIKLFKDFHFLSTIYHDLIISSIMNTFLNINKLDEQIFDKVLDNILMKSIIWICSSKLLVDVQWDTMTDWKENVTIKNYTPLLKGLINHLNDEFYEISQKIYDKFIQILFKISDKLNLTTVNRSSTKLGETGDPNIDLNPVKPKDYHIFFNLVDLQKLLLNDNMEMHKKFNFLKWIGIWFENMIEKSLEYPLVSGFLKLLSIALKISRYINYTQFNDNLFNYLNSIITKAKQSIGDYQLSCIQLIFSTPVKIIVLLNNYECIFLNAFAIGINMIWLADYGLTTLQKVVNYLNTDKVKQTKLLNQILPCFDSYLLSKIFSRKDELKHDLMVKEYRKSKKIKKLLQSQFDGENELVKFQKKIVIFLGTLEPHICLLLLSKKNENQNSLKWDVEQKVRLRLESEQLSPVIYLDSMMPQISELALKSSNRQTKLTACELIHATVLYLMANNNHKGEIWKRLCSILFYLGCDNDVAVQEMFEPLLIQIMHYLSQPSEINSDGSKILIECVMILISHENNYGIRALSARCLREFLVWHIKQTPHEQIDNTAFKLYNIIEHLKLMSFDSNNCKRLGASLAFNNVYAVLREEDDFINVYWLELFYAFSINYMLTESANCDLTNIESTINHLTRVLSERKELFIELNPNRATVEKFKSNDMNGLCHWILEQMNTKLINFRRKLMKIYIELFQNLNDLPNINDILVEFKNKNFDVLKILDIYVWILENNLLDELFLNDSYIFKIIINYIKNHFNAYDDKIIFLIIKLINYETFFRYVPDEMWVDDTKFLEILNKLSFDQNKLIIPILNDLIVKLPMDFKRKLRNQIVTDINATIKNTIDSNFSVVCNPTKINAIQILLQNKSLISEIDESIRNDLLDKLTNYDNIILNASERNTLARIMTLCFLNSYSKQIIKLIMNNYNFFRNFGEIITNNFLKFSKLYIIEFLLNLNESNVIDIVKILNTLYTNIYNNKTMANQNDLKQLNANYFSIFDKIFNFLNILSANIKNYEYTIIELTMNMAMICCESLEKFGNNINKNCEFKNWLYQLLKSPQISVEIKVNAFNLLSCFTGPNDVNNKELMDTLKEIQGKYFPLNTSELPIQSIERSQYVSLFLALLNNLAITKSPILLEFLVISTASDNKHILEWKIEENLKLFLKNKKISQQLIAINIALDLFFNENLEVTLRLNILNRCVINLIKYSYSHTITEFYKLNIKKINELTNRALTGRGINIEQSIVSKLSGYMLIEQLFSLVSKENITNKESPILKAYFDNDSSKIKTGAELTRDFMKKAFNFRQETFYSDNNEILELYRLLQCRTYNCLATIVSNTQEDVKFYASLLFNEKIEKNEFIWKQLVNTTNENLYIFPQEFDQFPGIKDKIVSIRNIRNDNQPIKYSYIQSINVFESSLSQDVTKIDLTNSFIKSNEETDDASKNGNENQYSASVICLEKNSLNDHEIMPTLCGVIKHMFDNKIVLLPENNVLATPPIWVKSIVTSLSEVNQKNVRIFLAKLIDNCRSYFKYYAPFLFAPICKIIVDGCAGENLNSFNVDLISLLISWNELYKPSTLEEISLLSELLKFIMKNSYHPRKDIFKLNLDIIKSVTELWGSLISIPVQLLFDLIDEKLDKGKIMCGINFNAIFLSNEILPWTEATQANFIRAIINCINHEDNKIYQGASQLIGLCLNYLHDCNEFDQIVAELNEMIKEIRKKNDKKAMEILYSIQKYYSKILENYKNIIAYNIPNSVGTIKKLYLEMMLNGIELYEEDIIYNEIISIGLKDLLKHHEYQLMCLHILNRAIPKFSLNNVNSIFEEISGFVKSDNRDCRDVSFEILIYLNNNVHRLANSDFDKEIVKVIGKKCQMNLLVGLSDLDQLIKNRLYNYWTNHPQLKKDLSLRLKTIFSDLYDENIEKYFLSYCCYLLLELVISRPSSKQNFIDYYPQNDFKMIEYNINTDWKSSNRSTITPIFVESQQRSVLSGDGVEMSKYLRVTQTNLAFEPTQDPTIITSTNDNFILPTHSSFVFDFTPQVLNRRSQNMPLSATQEEESESNKTFKELENKFRKRFVKINEESGRVQALKSIDRRNYNQSKIKFEMKRKEKTVQLYRRYRIGDHPDLSLNLLALLLPLQNLVMHDTVVARQILVSIFTAIVNEDNQLSWAINSSIDGILKKSKYCEPMLFGTLMEMIFHSPEHCFTSPDIISTLSINNNMIICGILHLENRLLLDLEEDETSSKSSSSTLNLETKYWIKLAELYFNLKESDIVSSIYSDKLKSNPLLAKGIQNENEGNFKSAQHNYLEILNSVQNNPIEQDFCFQSFYECFSHMGQWKELSQYVQKQVNNNNEFWSEWNKENCLPHYIKSELRLILNKEMVSVDFLNSVENWVKDSEKLDHLKHYFGEEMMMLHFANKEYRQARIFSDKSIVNFLYDWKEMSLLSSKLRFNELLNIRNVAEIHQYIDDLFSRGEDDEMDGTVNKLNRTVSTLADRWNSTQLNESTSVLLWDKIITYRKAVLNNLQVENKETLNNAIINLNFKLLNIADKQNYINLFETIVKRISFLKDSSNNVNRLQWILNNFKINMLKSRFKIDTNVEQSYRMLIKSWNKIQTELCENSSIALNTESYPILIAGYQEIHSITLTLLKIIPNLPPNYDFSAINQFALNNVDTITGKLFQHTLYCLEKCITLVDKCYCGLEARKIKMDSYYAMAQFCYEFFEYESMVQEFDIATHLITSVLSSMRYDSIDARKLFPYLLQLKSLNDLSNASNDRLSKLFNEEIINIPDWMFVEWISSMISYYKYDQRNYLDELILRLCRSYPNAVIYPFKLSLNQYFYLNRIDESQVRGFVRQLLNDYLSNQLQNKFIENLIDLCIPSVKLEFHLKKLYSMIKKKSISTNEDFLYESNYLYNSLYSTDNSNNNKSDCYKNIMKYKEMIRDLQLKKFETDKHVIETRLIEMIRQLKELKSNKNEMNLSELSSWLYQYKSFEYDDESGNSIEIPGQYINCQAEPQLQHHVKIIHFYKQIYVFDSLRKPIKLQVFGSNGKKYVFLIKYGEDLRQDERIQKMFHLMSKQMKLNKNCASHELDIRTYKIVPISRYCGITSWLDNTQTLINFIQSSINRRSNANPIKYNNQILHNASNLYLKFIMNPSKNEDNTNLDYVYGKVVTMYDRNKIISNYNSVANILPADLLKFALIEISCSPENYFGLRNKYTTSLATNSICQWILGIGDRNLSNIMLNDKSGELISIDFGHAFGTGILNLSVPELIPFRLTPQILNVMQPLGVTGMLSKCMTHTLRCLQQSRKLIMACMEVFVKEPILDWLDVVHEELMNYDQNQFQPSERIKIALKKLSGYNPATLTKIQLKSGVIARHENYLEKYLKLLSGIEQFNIRARLADDNLSVEEQVAILLDMATDPAILGITYHGLQPYI